MADPMSDLKFPSLAIRDQWYIGSPRGYWRCVDASSVPYLGNGLIYEIRTGLDGYFYARGADDVVSGGWSRDRFEFVSATRYIGEDPPPKKPPPALPPEVWIDKARRSAVDFTGITRLIAEGSKHGKEN
jgi:hypothetical protein